MQSYPTPEGVVKVEVMNRDMTKFHLGDNKVLHKFTGPDTGFPHDHQFAFETTILSGGYIEREYIPLPDGTYKIRQHTRLPGTTHRVEANTIHLLIALLGSECWTLMKAEAKTQESSFFDFGRPDGIHRCFWYDMERGGWKPLSA